MKIIKRTSILLLSLLLFACGERKIFGHPVTAGYTYLNIKYIWSEKMVHEETVKCEPIAGLNRVYVFKSLFVPRSSQVFDGTKTYLLDAGKAFFSEEGCSETNQVVDVRTGLYLMRCRAKEVILVSVGHDIKCDWLSDNLKGWDDDEHD